MGDVGSRIRVPGSQLAAAEGKKTTGTASLPSDIPQLQRHCRYCLYALFAQQTQPFLGRLLLTHPTTHNYSKRFCWGKKKKWLQFQKGLIPI